MSKNIKVKKDLKIKVNEYSFEDEKFKEKKEGKIKKKKVKLYRLMNSDELEKIIKNKIKK